MTTLIVKNGNGDVVYLKGTGAGTELDPFIAEHSFALPADAATASAQATAQATLTAIATSADNAATDADAIRLATQSVDSKTPALIGGESPMADAQLRTRIGNTTDAEASAGDGTVIALLKRARTLLSNIATSVAGTLNISGSVTVSNLPGTQPVSGSVAVSNFPATQPISAAALPLPADAATQTTLAAVNAKLPDLEGGRLPVSIPAAETPAPDDSLNFTRLFGGTRAPMYIDRATGRVRISIEAGTLPNITNVGGINAAVAVRAAMNTAWALQSQRIYG